jgi:hypothetical protein
MGFFDRFKMSFGDTIVVPDKRHYVLSEGVKIRIWPWLAVWWRMLSIENFVERHMPHALRLLFNVQGEMKCH